CKQASLSFRNCRCDPAWSSQSTIRVPYEGRGKAAASLRDVALMPGNVLQIDEICGIRALELSGACLINLFPVGPGHCADILGNLCWMTDGHVSPGWPAGGVRRFDDTRSNRHEHGRRGAYCV